MEKRDYKKLLSEFYKASAKKVVVVDVPAMNFLIVTGKGEPGSESHQQAIEALYSVAYTLKFMIKKSELAIDYGVMPLEGQWWADDMNDFITGNKQNWQWQMMIMQPELITRELVEQAMQTVAVKKDLPALDKVQFQSIAEGKCAQTLHVGPFSEEGPTVERVHQHIESLGGQLSGRHKEVYLSDIRRARPENWKTIIRQPYSA
ncbi:hypothetical protein EXU30_10755 [Shewanella maritima]|uniref:GyrI-like small molecule binding domain-containing protein n=1 Tax=Shewanella maritima TaxID=2520507 RepID=A0A411PIE6_9GAMM|nr:GyrI-like domain-containing protein [Shewanella maritima]QBF83120.1 hypothetical protein EXU30_10755 [Shewanella maritima]